MSENLQHQTDEIIPAQKKPNSLFSIVWLIPLVALITGIWLVIDHVRSSGPEIILHIQDAEGIDANSTLIKMRNVEVGKVSKLTLSKDRKSVELEVKMTSGTEDLLNENTSFWLVKPRIGQFGVSGLTTLVSGAYIEMVLGGNGKEKKEFDVGDTPYAYSSQNKGKRLILESENLNMLSVGTSVLYHSIPVGIVESADFDTKNKKVRYRILINKPNDQLLGSKVHFWQADGIKIEATGKGFNIDTLPLGMLLSGAIVFSEPENGQKGEEVADDTVFTLYPSKESIVEFDDQEVISVVSYFDQSIRSLSQGASVEYKGIKVGEVREVPYFLGEDKTRIFQEKLVPVLFYIDPLLLGNKQSADIAQLKQKLLPLLEKKLVVSLSTDSLVTGAQFIDLGDRTENDGILIFPKKKYGSYPVIASKKSGLDTLQEGLNRLLEKLNKLPIEKTLTELNQSLASVNQLLKDTKRKELPQEIKKTLEDMRQVLQGVSADSPLNHEVRQTLQNLNQTLKRAEPILRTINEKPNALIFNNPGEDLIPRGAANE